MGEIFVLALQMDLARRERAHVGLQGYFDTSPLALSSVCRFWKSSAISFALLWARIDVEKKSVGVYGLEQWIARSGNRPLTISLTEVPNAILKVVAAHPSRWMDVSLSRILPEDVKCFLGTTVNEGRTPLLRRFSAGYFDPSPSSSPVNTADLKVFKSKMRYRLSRLEEWVVSEQYLLVLPNIYEMRQSSRHSLVFESRYFHALRKISQPRMQQWEEFHASLLLFPKLEELQVYADFQGTTRYPPCPVTHSNLKTLTILVQSCNPNTLHAALKQLHLPALENIYIAPNKYYTSDFNGTRNRRVIGYTAHAQEGPWIALVTMLRRSTPPAPLQSVQIFIPPASNELASALPYMTNVKFLGVMNAVTFGTFLDSSVLPQLSKLTLNQTVISSRTVAELFKARANSMFGGIQYFSSGMSDNWESDRLLKDLRFNGYEIEEIGPHW